MILRLLECALKANPCVDWLRLQQVSRAQYSFNVPNPSGNSIPQLLALLIRINLKLMTLLSFNDEIQVHHEGEIYPSFLQAFVAIKFRWPILAANSPYGA